MVILRGELQSIYCGMNRQENGARMNQYLKDESIFEMLFTDPSLGKMI